MQITKLLNDKEIKHGLLLVDKYPKPINKNNKLDDFLLLDIRKYNCLNKVNFIHLETKLFQVFKPILALMLYL